MENNGGGQQLVCNGTSSPGNENGNSTLCTSKNANNSVTLNGGKMCNESIELPIYYQASNNNSKMSSSGDSFSETNTNTNSKNRYSDLYEKF